MRENGAHIGMEATGWKAHMSLKGEIDSGTVGRGILLQYIRRLLTAEPRSDGVLHTLRTRPLLLPLRVLPALECPGRMGSPPAQSRSTMRYFVASRRPPRVTQIGSLFRGDWLRTIAWRVRGSRVWMDTMPSSILSPIQQKDPAG